MTPQSKKHKSRQPKEDRDALIRHHCEEISTHLAALKQLLESKTPNGPESRKHLKTIGEYFKKIYIKHGGVPH